jgi:uncharacterized membrane protein
VTEATPPAAPARKPRRWGLWLSIGLNVVLIAALLGGVMRARAIRANFEERIAAAETTPDRAQTWREHWQERRDGGADATGPRGGPGWLGELTPDARAEVRAVLGQTLRDARPFAEAARQARREALEAAQQPEASVEEVQTAFARVREADARLQQHMHEGTIAALAGLSPEARLKAVEGMLRGRGLDRRPPPNAPPG